VNVDGNRQYAALLAAVARETGVPMVLNTSFNENEPIVHQPAEAIDCFLRTRMDVIVLGHHVVTKGAAARDADA
jgi:carbamoyltransferase